MAPYGISVDTQGWIPKKDEVKRDSDALGTGQSLLHLGPGGPGKAPRSLGTPHIVPAEQLASLVRGDSVEGLEKDSIWCIPASPNPHRKGGCGDPSHWL